eukprot:Skav222410  [mRNA]  locus=scaffold4005:159598:161703:+ [translate_table: standard]
MRKVSKNALALAMDQAELKIREELASKIAQIRKERSGGAPGMAGDGWVMRHGPVGSVGSMGGVGELVMRNAISIMTNPKSSGVKEEHARVKRDHEDEAEDAETKAREEQEEAEKRIEDRLHPGRSATRPPTDEPTRPHFTTAAAQEKLESAKRRLESLTGQPVKETVFSMRFV